MIRIFRTILKVFHYGPKVTPPSTSNVNPVVYLLSIKVTIPYPTSENVVLNSVCPVVRGCSDCSTIASGEILLTLIGLSSRANPFESASSAAFTATFWPTAGIIFLLRIPDTKVILLALVFGSRGAP